MKNSSKNDLKEVTIKAEKIWGKHDTINYLVDAFRDTTDIVIGDVLKKMPDYRDNEKGQVKYRGKPISKFYIENMDMLQGRYGIATNNISASDIATVQVFENHQPIKALQDVTFSDDAAINLKLKQGAKGIYTLMANLGGGTDSHILWNCGITGMYFGRKWQQLVSYKTNNTGDDLENEFISFTDNPPFSGNRLSSNLLREQAVLPLTEIPGDSMMNNQEWLRSKTGFSLDFRYRKGKIFVTLSTPVIIRNQFHSKSNS